MFTNWLPFFASRGVPAYAVNLRGRAGSRPNIDLGRATIDDFADNGLGSGKTLLAGFPAADPATGAAFPGINPLVGENEMFFPVGRSVYNGLQVKLTQNLANPLSFVQNSNFVRNLNLIASYALSRFKNTAGPSSGTLNVGDQDFINNATDFNHPTQFIGPNALDRRHQFSIGGIFDFPYALRYSIVAHWSSRLPQTLTLLNQQRSGEIFHTDLTGDGTVGDVLPGTNIGSAH